MIVLLTIGIFLGFYIFATKNTPRIKSFLLGIAAGVFVFFLFFVRNTLYSFVLLPEKTLLFNIVVEETTKIVALLFILRSKPPSSYWSAYGIGWGFASVEHLVLVISQGNISLARMLFASTLHIITLFCFLFVLHIRKKEMVGSCYEQYSHGAALFLFIIHIIGLYKNFYGYNPPYELDGFSHIR